MREFPNSAVEAREREEEKRREAFTASCSRLDIPEEERAVSKERALVEKYGWIGFPFQLPKGVLVSTDPYLGGDTAGVVPVFDAYEICVKIRKANWRAFDQIHADPSPEARAAWEGVDTSEEAAYYDAITAFYRNYASLTGRRYVLSPEAVLAESRARYRKWESEQERECRGWIWWLVLGVLAYCLCGLLGL